MVLEDTEIRLRPGDWLIVNGVPPAAATTVTSPPSSSGSSSAPGTTACPCEHPDRHRGEANSRAGACPAGVDRLVGDGLALALGARHARRPLGAALSGASSEGTQALPAAALTGGRAGGCLRKAGRGGG